MSNLDQNIIRVNEVSECLKSESKSDRGSWLLSRVPVLLGESVEISLRSSENSANHKKIVEIYNHRNKEGEGNRSRPNSE